MTLQVEISQQNTEQIISAIKLLKGVKSVKTQKEVIEPTTKRGLRQERI